MSIAKQLEEAYWKLGDLETKLGVMVRMEMTEVGFHICVGDRERPHRCGFEVMLYQDVERAITAGTFVGEITDKAHKAAATWSKKQL